MPRQKNTRSLRVSGTWSGGLFIPPLISILSVHCYVADADVAEQARLEGVTRSIVALRKGVQAGCRIFLIGNAPTALYELLRFCKEEGAQPDLIVGAPVGFVGAAESKQALVESGLPQITCRGRKGGSAIAAAIFNAIVLLAKQK